MKTKCILMASLIFTNLFYISCETPDNIIVNGGPDTPLHTAVRNDDIEEVKRLLTEEGWKEVIESYSLFQREKISKTPDMNIIGHYGGLPLFYVKSLEMAKFLISKGADVNATDESGETPLHKGLKDVSIAKLYLEHGADVNAKNKYGDTPLHKIGGNIAVAKLYLEHGADIEATNGDGRSPYDEANQVGPGAYSYEIRKFFICVKEKNLKKNFSICVP